MVEPLNTTYSKTRAMAITSMVGPLNTTYSKTRSIAITSMVGPPQHYMFYENCIGYNINSLTAQGHSF